MTLGENQEKAPNLAFLVFLRCHFRLFFLSKFARNNAGRLANLRLVGFLKNDPLGCIINQRCCIIDPSPKTGILFMESPMTADRLVDRDCPVHFSR